MKSIVTTLLRPFADVREQEVASSLLLALNVFVVMMAYYVLKSVREPLVLAGEAAALFEGGGAEVKSYLAAAQALVLIGAVPLYGKLVERFDRGPLVMGVTAFFVVCIELFHGAALVGVPYLGVPFYIWVGIFSLAVIAQFWSFANDVYSREQGERLFPLIGVGMTAGAVAGSWAADALFDAGVGPFAMLQLSAVLLIGSAGLYAVGLRALPTVGEEQDDDAPEDEAGGGTGFGLIIRRPYLRWVAALFLLLNLVNTTGEFLLADLVEEAAHASGEDVEAWIGSFYAEFYFWVNLGAIATQALVVSRLSRLGIGWILFALPVVSLGTYGLAAAGVGLGVWRWAKTAENLTDYSVMNTAKAMLWLPTTRAEKYKAKQAIDTFVVRLGDVASALVVFLGLNVLQIGRQGFALANLGFIALWLLVTLAVWRGYRAAADDT
jgi:AAA family ATP:ADP antiporter